LVFVDESAQEVVRSSLPFAGRRLTSVTIRRTSPLGTALDRESSAPGSAGKSQEDCQHCPVLLADFGVLVVALCGRLGCFAVYVGVWEWEKIGRVGSACRCLCCCKLTSTDLCCVGDSLFLQVTVLSGGQGVAGSNPVVPTARTSPLTWVNTQVSGLFRARLLILQCPSTMVRMEINRAVWEKSGRRS
jgi:hypothetical protein